jgi:hypothetical protein
MAVDGTNVLTSIEPGRVMLGMRECVGGSGTWDVRTSGRMACEGQSKPVRASGEHWQTPGGGGNRAMGNGREGTHTSILGISRKCPENLSH